jgi:hypothetical protein
MRFSENSFKIIVLIKKRALRNLPLPLDDPVGS